MCNQYRIFLAIICVCVINVCETHCSNQTLTNPNEMSVVVPSSLRNCVSSFRNVIECFRTRNFLTCLRSIASIRGLSLNLNPNQNQNPNPNQNSLSIVESLINYLLQAFHVSDVIRLKMLNGTTSSSSSSTSSFLSQSFDVVLQIKPTNQINEFSRKMKMKMSNIVGMMLMPPLIMAGLVPFIIPGFSMAVFLNSILNNMAFTSAIFTFIRSNIFDTDPHDNIIYVNNGYSKHPNDLSNKPPHYYH